MNTRTKSFALTACLALALGAQLPLHADDAPTGARPAPPTGDTPRRPGGGSGGFFGFRGPAYEALSQEEKDKLKAAGEKAMQDSKVKDARDKMQAANKEFRDAMKAAEIAADPTVEPILKKLEESGGGRRGSGRTEQPAK